MTTRDSTPAVTSSLRANGTEPASEAPAWRDLVLQGGRVTKYKGIACGTAPHCAAVASIGVSLAAAAAFSFGGILVSSTAAFAGDCGPGPSVVCSGAADPVNDTTQTFTGSDISIVTDPGFGLDVASGNAITSTVGTDGFSFVDANGSVITGNNYGFEINNSTSGDIVIRSNGDITGTNWDAIEATNNAGTGGIIIDVNNLDGGRRGVEAVNNGNGAIDITVSGTINSGWAGIYANGGATSTGLTIDANNIASDLEGIDVDYSGTGLVDITSAGSIEAGNYGIIANIGGNAEGLDIDAASITSSDDTIYGSYGGVGTVNITVHDSMVSGDDGIEFYATNGGVGQINIDFNNVKAGDHGIYVINHSDAIDPTDPNAVNNDMSITTRGRIEAGSGAAIWAETDAGVHTNIVIKSTSVLTAASGLAIVNDDGNSHVIIENAAEVVDNPNTPEVEMASVNGAIRLGWGGDRLDLHGGFSGITEVNGGHGGTNSDDVLNLFDATSTYNANNIVGWDVFNISNSYLTLDGGLGNLNVGTAGVAGTGIFLTNGSTLESKQHGLNIYGNLTLDAGTTFLSDVNNDAGNPGRGDTYITGFLTNAGTVSIADGAADDDLAVWGLYTGNNGTVIIDTVLGGDTSATDTMTFSGGTAVGTTSVVVNNVGGLGAQTANGIKIIDVSGVSDGTFSLIGHYEVAGQQAVIAGAYGYTLWKNGVNTPNDGDWYLRSQSTAGGLIYQPGTPVFEAYPQVLLGLNGLSTLQQRVGNRMWSGNGAGVVSQGADAVAEQAPVEEGASPFIEGRGIWGRIEGAHANIDPSVSTTGSEYDFNTLKFQAGLDIQVLENGSGVLVGGVTVHYGHASADVSSPSGDGSISTDGFGVGGTLTWYGNNGFYVDAQGQVSWYDSDLASGQLGTLTSGNDATGYALSLETGKRIELNNGLTLTPQAQLVYSSVDFDTFTQTLGGQDIADVSLLNGDSLRGRLGISLDREASWQADNGLLSRSHVYGIANLHYEFLDGTAVDVSDAAFSTRSDRLWGGVGLGGSYNWNDDKFSLYGEGSVNTSLENFADSYELKGTAGLRVSW